MANIFTQKFETILSQEKNDYQQFLDNIQQNIDLVNETFNYEQVISLFCKLSMFHNVQANLLQTLMKMIGSICQQRNPIGQEQKSQQQTKPNYMDIFQQNDENSKQKLKPFLNSKNKDDSNVIIISNDEESHKIDSKNAFKEQKKALFKKQFKQFKKNRDEIAQQKTHIPKLDQFIKEQNSKRKSMTEQSNFYNINEQHSLPNQMLFRETVRNKKEREQMDAHFCKDCERFYSNFTQDSQIDEWKDMCSKHRSNNRILQEKILLTPEG